MQYLSTSTLLAKVPDIILTLPYFGELDITRYVVSLAIFAALLLFFYVLREIVLARLQALSQKTVTDFDDTLIAVVKGIRWWIYLLVAFYGALQFLPLTPMIDRILTGITLLAVVWQAIETILEFIKYGVRRAIEKDEDGDGIVDPNAATASDMVTLLSRIVLWSLGLLFVLSNLGIEVTSLIAGLGIGGIAVAFALQGILSDLFASFSLYFDKPFRIGDFVVIGSDMGTIEKIGIKSTRIRTLQGEELVVSNAELTTTRVQNFKKMEERRITFEFGITYETPPQKVKEVPSVVKHIFEATDNTRFDRAHFKSFGDSALVFEVVYFVLSSDYNQFMDIQQEVNFQLMERLSEMNIEFAYPTQTLYVKKVG